jgi:hypothetical protein
MRSKYAFYLLIVLFVTFNIRAGYANSETFSTGKEWVEKMSKGEKFISVYAPMILFYRYGVNFRKTPGEYTETIDKVLLNNPYLEKEDIANIFASTVYAYEPESRPAFRQMAMELSSGEFSPHLLITPNSTPEVTQSSEE